jgi:DNA invertase Pin-like site-specific DNA recombinase
MTIDDEIERLRSRVRYFEDVLDHFRKRGAKLYSNNQEVDGTGPINTAIANLERAIASIEEWKA